MLPHVDQPGSSRQVVANQARGRLREQDLAAMTDPAQACAPIDRRSVIVVISNLCVPRGGADPARDRAGRWPGLGGEGPLDRQCRCNRIRSVREDGETAVSLASWPDVNPAVLVDGL